MKYNNNERRGAQALEAAKERRGKTIERMKVMLYEEVKARTRKEITDFNVW